MFLFLSLLTAATVGREFFFPRRQYYQLARRKATMKKLPLGGYFKASTFVAQLVLHGTCPNLAKEKASPCRIATSNQIVSLFTSSIFQKVQFARHVTENKKKLSHKVHYVNFENNIAKKSILAFYYHITRLQLGCQQKSENSLINNSASCKLFTKWLLSAT